MSPEKAQQAVVVSALTVAGIYGYRRATEAPTKSTKLKNLAGVGAPPPLGIFATAWGFTFFVVSLLATASPGLGASFAILIATSDFLTNAQPILTDIAKGTGGTNSASAPISSGVMATPAANVAATAGGGLAAAGGITNQTILGLSDILGGTSTVGPVPLSGLAPAPSYPGGRSSIKPLPPLVPGLTF